MMWSACVVLLVLAAVEGEKTSGADKKRGLYDETYPGALARQDMLIKTHFAPGQDVYAKERGLRYALLSAYPVAQIPLAKYASPQRYIVLRKMPVTSAVPAALASAPIPSAVPYGLAYQQETPIYTQQAHLYPTLPYQVKMQYAAGRYPYEYAPQVRYYVSKGVPLVTEDSLDYQARPPIDERSAYQLSPALQKPGIPVQEPSIYMPKQYYIQTTKEVYPEAKPIAYAISVPDHQIALQKPIYLPVVEKNIQ